MDYENNQPEKFTPEKQRGLTRIKRYFIDSDIECTDLSDIFDTSRMSRNIYDVFIFSRKIINITNEMWMKIFNTTSQKEKLRGRAVCYNICDEEKCVDLNIVYYTFTSELVSYQKRYNNSQKHDDYLNFVKNVLGSLDKFVFSAFPSLENDIEHLLIEVYMINRPNKQHPFRLYKKENVGFEVNQSILYYFRILKQIVLRLKLVNAPSELAENKKIIVFKIDKAFEKKINYLRKDKSIDKNTVVDNKTVIKTTSCIDFYYEPNAISSSDYINQNFEIVENDHPTEKINASAFVKLKFLGLDYPLQYNLSDEIVTGNINGKSLTSAIKYVIAGSFFALIISFIIFVVISVRKRKAKRKQPSSNELI
ncbi:hypothetical protein NBO_7g0036 [Nosema bombycis CQ1]|uniref:Uncharacterized protein n=1 Tax=Nosema bombycis (strain CQ1 / CVCC 102059) TaxID=578461 RepID=R0MQP6_NOSB1|nr:hypothetical protein NBO_7g0036 [Nosema bombycis CQ1]|eukprot:EOB15218.1 hypothetical protein NBO_7g0036 [Nosema bombycis CQ1]